MMTTQTLLIKDLKILKRSEAKLYAHKALLSEERAALINFLKCLFTTDNYVDNGWLLEKPVEIKLLDFSNMSSHLDRWLELFNKLPANGDLYLPHAWLTDLNDDSYWRDNAIITIAFIPSLKKSKMVGLERIVNLYLKVDGSAKFAFNHANDSNDFPQFNNFKGTWKEAYLLTVNTLQQGWPQIVFPKEFEQFLKKE